MAVQTQIQARRGTAATWTSTNPTLAAGETGFETDTGKFKIGTGSLAWNSLAYAGGATAVTYLFNATAGQTTFSGADANGLTLAYTVGAEQVYLNGVLQVRGSDYTATNGTSIVLTSGALVSDVLNVIAYSAMTITDTYTQAQADAKFVQVLNTPNPSNPVLNSAFQVWQRGTSFSASNSSGTSYWADRWSMYFGTITGYTLSQQSVSDSTNLPNIQYCARIARSNGTTGTNGGTIGQSIEIVNSIPFAGKTVTLSFYARKGANYSGTTITATLKSGTGTSDSNGIYNTYTGQATVATTSPTLTTTWARYSVTGTVGSTATQLALAIDSAHTGTSGAADYYEITGVQLEIGSTATPFRTFSETIQGELAACQRYYMRFIPATSYERFGQGSAINTLTAVMQIPFKVTMRTYPSTPEYSMLAVYDGVTLTAVTSVTLDQSGVNNISINANVASGLTQYRPYQLLVNGSLSGYLGFSAEL